MNTKKIRNASTYYPPRTNRKLSARVHILLMANLENPVTETLARNMLATARKRGFRFHDADLQCEDCLACLYVSLMSAAEVMSKEVMSKEVTSKEVTSKKETLLH